MQDEKNFFAGLFDFSFNSLLTRRIVKLLYLIVVEVGYNQSVVSVQRGYKLREIVVRNAGAQLTVEFIDGFGGERVIVDGLNSGADLISEEDVSLAVTNVILQTFVGSIPRAALIPKLPGL